MISKWLDRPKSENSINIFLTCYSFDKGYNSRYTKGVTLNKSMLLLTFLCGGISSIFPMEKHVVLKRKKAKDTPQVLSRTFSFCPATIKLRRTLCGNNVSKAEKVIALLPESLVLQHDLCASAPCPAIKSIILAGIRTHLRNKIADDLKNGSGIRSLIAEFSQLTNPRIDGSHNCVDLQFMKMLMELKEETLQLHAIRHNRFLKALVKQIPELRQPSRLLNLAARCAACTIYSEKMNLKELLVDIPEHIEKLVVFEYNQLARSNSSSS